MGVRVPPSALHILAGQNPQRLEHVRVLESSDSHANSHARKKTMWKSGSPKAVTPLSVIAMLAQRIEGDLTNDLFISEKANEIVELLSQESGL